MCMQATRTWLPLSIPTPPVTHAPPDLPVPQRHVPRATRLHAAAQRLPPRFQLDPERGDLLALRSTLPGRPVVADICACMVHPLVALGVKAVNLGRCATVPLWTRLNRHPVVVGLRVPTGDLIPVAGPPQLHPFATLDTLRSTRIGRYADAPMSRLYRVWFYGMCRTICLCSVGADS